LKDYAKGTLTEADIIKYGRLVLTIMSQHE